MLYSDESHMAILRLLRDAAGDAWGVGGFGLVRLIYRSPFTSSC